LRSSGVQADKDPAKPSFRSGLFLQLTNVKIMICCLTAMTSYVLPYSRSFWHLLAVGLFMPFTGPIANLLWLFAGASLQKLFSNHRKIVDIVMAIALALCALSLVWPSIQELIV
jgi:cysteine/O-acetylserine efflux protein